MFNTVFISFFKAGTKMIAKSSAISVLLISFFLINVVSAIRFKNEITNRYLEEFDGKVISRASNGQNSQQWNVVPTFENNLFRIVNVLTNKHLETDFTGRVFTADPSGTSAQEWRYQDTNNVQQLVNRGTNFYLDAGIAENDLYANFQSGTKYQNWLRENQ